MINVQMLGNLMEKVYKVKMLVTLNFSPVWISLPPSPPPHLQLPLFEEGDSVLAGSVDIRGS